MNRYLTLILIILCLFMIGCSSSKANTVNQNQVLMKTDHEGFYEPDPSEWNEYIKPVRKYLHYRTQSVLKKDIQVLWGKYPLLQNNSDQKSGINDELNDIETLNNSSNLIDANFSEESRSRINVNKINDNDSIVLVHGDIVYLSDDFDESGSEILIKLFLEQKDNEWIVVKTDEYTEAEYKEWIKNNQK